jgi:hypothetical protein
MSRSGYGEDGDNWALIRWRGAVASAICGKRGQSFLKEALNTLDRMSVKELYPNSFAVDPDKYCLLGAVAADKAIEVSDLGDAEDGCDLSVVADRFGVAPALVAEIMFENDESIEEELCSISEICGPVRPGYPDWGRHVKKVWEVNHAAPAQRWRYMRNWVEKNIIGGTKLSA